MKDKDMAKPAQHSASEQAALLVVVAAAVGTFAFSQKAQMA